MAACIILLYRQELFVLVMLTMTQFSENGVEH